jgi:hypothetical protein
MKRKGLTGSLLVAVLAIGAIGATGASAALPEFGRCVKVTHGTGEYNGGNCVALGGGRNYNWVAGPGATPKFTISTEFPVINSSGASKTTISCEFAEGEGEYTGVKSETVKKLVFRDCETPEKPGETPEEAIKRWCQNVGNFRGEITASELSGELGYITATTLTGLDVKPLSGSNLAAFECGGANETTERGMGTGISRELQGSVIGRVANVNRMTTEGLVKYIVNKKGIQVPEHLEGGTKDTLTTLVGLVEKTPEATTFSGVEGLTNAGALEVKTK